MSAAIFIAAAALLLTAIKHAHPPTCRCGRHFPSHRALDQHTRTHQDI